MNLILHYVVPFLIVLGVLVFVHEFGHFWVGRRCGVRVDAFSIGFGPEILGWTDRYGTRWKICLIPLGGYVKFFGDADATSRPEMPGEGDDEIPLTAEEKAVSFHHKPVRQRAAVVVAGPMANFIFAAVVLTGLYTLAGSPYPPATIGEVTEDGAAAEAGLRAGDEIVGIDGHPIQRFIEVVAAVGASDGQPMTLEIQRDGDTFPVSVTPEKVTVELPAAAVQSAARQGDTDTADSGAGEMATGESATGESATGESGAVGDDGMVQEDVWRLGIVADSGPFNLFRSAGMAVSDTVNLSWQTLVMVGRIVVGQESASGLGGPLRIAQMSGEFSQIGIAPFLWFMAILSINLGLINLFPVPMLDGGHLAFYTIEALRGRPLGPRAQEYGFRIGLALVLALVVFVTWNDLVQLEVFSFLRDIPS